MLIRGSVLSSFKFRKLGWVIKQDSHLHCWYLSVQGSIECPKFVQHSIWYDQFWSFFHTTEQNRRIYIYMVACFPIFQVSLLEYFLQGLRCHDWWETPSNNVPAHLPKAKDKDFLPPYTKILDTYNHNFFDIESKKALTTLFMMMHFFYSHLRWLTQLKINKWNCSPCVSYSRFQIVFWILGSEVY